MKILCALARYANGDPAREPSYEYANFLPTLKRLGHGTVFFDTLDRARYADLRQRNAAFLALARQEQPDVLLNVPFMNDVWLETVERIGAETPTATLAWMTDDSWRYESFSRFIAPAFRAVATTDPAAADKYRRDGMGHVLLTQWAANADHLHPPLPAPQCKYPVSFVGAAHGDRRHWIETLRRRGIEVACFGLGWPAGTVTQDEMMRVIRESRICINFSSSSFSATSGRVAQIKARVFETPGAGGFLLAQWVEGLDRWYAPGEEIAVFRDSDDLAEKITYYLSHLGERDAIARAGFERTRRDHLYDNRLAEALEFALASRGARRDQFAAGRRSPDPADAYRPCGPACRLIRRLLETAGAIVFGKQRATHFARRVVFELAWRLQGKRAYRVEGWTGRMFPDVP
ncbi:MAG: glycosyltransferase [Chloroflexi bacterium]|nr:glycosyltransferase [Chloroflexota bacterium]